MVSPKKKRRMWWGFKWELLPHRNVYRPLGGPRRWKEKTDGW